MMTPTAFWQQSGAIPAPFFTFKTKKSASVSFSITKTGIPATWYMGDGTIYTGVNSVTHTYANGSEKTVSISLGDSFANVTGLGDFSNKEITFFDASNFFLSQLFQSIQFNNNPITLFLPPIGVQLLLAVDFNDCPNLVNLDLSWITEFYFNVNARINFTNSNLLTNVLWPTNCGRGPRIITISSTGIQTVDLSGIINTLPSKNTALLIANGGVSAFSNFIQPTNGSVAFSINSASLTSLNVLNSILGGNQVVLIGMPLLTGVLKFANGAIVGTAATNVWLIDNCGFSSIDLSNISNIGSQNGTIAGFTILNNNNLTSLLMPSGVSSITVHNIVISGNSLIGHLNLGHLKPIVGNPQIVRVINEPGVTSITLWNNTNKISRLSFSTTPIGYINLTTHVNYNVGGISNTLGVSIRLENMDLTATEVNNYLVDADNNSVLLAGFRVIIIDGASNAAPDSSSGGFDGIAAKASLIAKGYNIQTN